MVTGLRRVACALTAAAAIAGAAAWRYVPAAAQVTPSPVAIDADDIGGVVSSPRGPEAGVWVIAETADLGTRFRKIVVTDDRGRFVVPDLPKANYSLWVRGYGLVDSSPSMSAPGRTLTLEAVPAPTPRAAAEVYPSNYWLSLINLPARSDFPGTGPGGNGIPPLMRSQTEWIYYMKIGCIVCHPVGSKATRELLPSLGHVRLQRRGLGAPLQGWAGPLHSREQRERHLRRDAGTSAGSAGCRCSRTGPIALPPGRCRTRHRGLRGSSETWC